MGVGHRLLLARFVPCPIGPTPDPLSPELIGEAVGHRIVVAFAAAAHGVNQIVVSQGTDPV